MASLADIRARAAEHERQREAERSWLTPAKLAARWDVSDEHVRQIPRDRLPYIELGTGSKSRRRYSPAAVEAFEAAGGLG